MNSNYLTVHNFRFLKRAVSLTSLSIGDIYLNGRNYEHLYEFIATHRSLTSFQFRMYIQIPWQQFVYVYERILTAVSQNDSIRVLKFNCYVSLGDMQVFANLAMTTLARRVSEISRILEGKDVLINGVRVDRIIQDLERDDDVMEELKSFGLKFLMIGESTRKNDDSNF